MVWRVSTSVLPAPPAPRLRGLQIVQIGHALPHLFEPHLHVIVLHPGFLGSGEKFTPVDLTLAYRNHLFLSRRPVLKVKRDKSSAWILLEDRGRIESESRHHGLELHLHQL